MARRVSFSDQIYAGWLIGYQEILEQGELKRKVSHDTKAMSPWWWGYKAAGENKTAAEATQEYNNEARGSNSEVR